MYNVKFTLSNGNEIFPIYMNSEKRSILKQHIGDKSEVMWCSCRLDKKLYYRISENLRFYPEHNGYEHSPYCIRYRTKDSKRSTAIVRSDVETATVYLQFNPKNFTIPTANSNDESDIEIDDSPSDDVSNTNSSEENEILHLDKLKIDNEEYKEPKFNLANFIRCVNHDTFTERIITHKPILTSDYFSNAIFGRLKDIHISGMKKSIRSLSLEEDGVRFFYAQFKGCDIKKSESNISYHLKLKGSDNKTYSYFTFGTIYEKALKRFNKQYGIDPNERTMIAGFQYYPTSKRGSKYKVVGRFHLFQVSEHGVYCNTLFEQDCYDIIIDYIKNNKDSKLHFYIPAEDETINGILEIEGYHKKGVIIFPSSKESKDFTLDKELYEPLLIAPNLVLSDKIMNAFIDRIKVANTL